MINPKCLALLSSNDQYFTNNIELKIKLIKNNMPKMYDQYAVVNSNLFKMLCMMNSTTVAILLNTSML